MLFSNTFKDKKVLITGHTGFKGGWLTIWLISLGSKVTGYSKDVSNKGFFFKETKLRNLIDHRIGDVRDLEKLLSLLEEIKPDYIFHLAAQAIVSLSYEDPIETMTTNIIGTVNLLEALRRTNIKCNAVIVTSDKCYENIESIWGYKEIDQLGGKDIYSGSKGAAEIIFHSYYSSFFKGPSSNVRVVSARAGNVIGGGDWARDRIVVDCIVNWRRKKPVKIRSMNSTRPWQHVLEPLSGYLSLAANLAKNYDINGESFNFGPNSSQNRTVGQLVHELFKIWKKNTVNTFKNYYIEGDQKFPESNLLKLNCEKAQKFINWESTLNFNETVKFVGLWYTADLNIKADMYKKTLDQIHEYEMLAKKRKIAWTN